MVENPEAYCVRVTEGDFRGKIGRGVPEWSMRPSSKRGGMCWRPGI